MYEGRMIWTPARILLIIGGVLVGFTTGLFLGVLSEQVRPSLSSHASETISSEQLYIPPPSTASPEIVVIRPELGAEAVADPKFFLTVDIVDEQGNPLVATVTVNRECKNERCSAADPAAQNFLALPMKCNGGEEDHEMLEVIAQAEGYYPARQRFDVTVVGHSSYHLVLTLEEIAPVEAPRS